MKRALQLEERSDWTTYRVNAGGLARREWYGFTMGSDLIPVIALASHEWNTAKEHWRDWPWVQGKNLTGGLYSSSIGRMVPFHRPDQWYQIAIPTWMVDPIHPERTRVARPVNLEVPE